VDAIKNAPLASYRLGVVIKNGRFIVTHTAVVIKGVVSDE